MRSLLVVLSLYFFLAPALAARPAHYFKRDDVANARYGKDGSAQILEMALKTESTINARVFGQEAVAKLTQDKLLQYLMSFPSRSGEPVALNLVGFPGVGKSEIVRALQNIGIKFVHIDAQNYADSKSGDFASDLYTSIQRFIDNNEPVILMVEELDKIPEVVRSAGENTEKTHPVIGTLGQILSDGQMTSPYSRSKILPFSNVFVVTTMNFPPSAIELFKERVEIDQNKTFYDFSIEDFKLMSDWLINRPEAIYNVLSRVFRPNTVSRIAPNTAVMRALGEEEYRAIARQKVTRVIQLQTQGNKKDRRLEFKFDDSLIDFIAARSIVPASGARETTFRSTMLIEQLVNFSLLAGDPNSPNSQDSLNRPRKIFARAGRAENSEDPSSVVLEVTPLKYSKEGLQEMETFSVTVSYDNATRSFKSPEVLRSKPQTVSKAKNASSEKPLTKKEVYENRFPKVINTLGDFEQRVSEKILGQTEAVKSLGDQLRKYLARKGPAIKEPPFSVFSGFPGIGKSALINVAAAEAKIPVVRVNLQQFASNTPETLKDFAGTLSKLIENARQSAPNGKYVLLIEEMDKTYEIRPDNGASVDRPVMGIIKDLLSEGVVSVKDGYNTHEIDIRDAYTCFTMNFAVDLFGFSADPRLTSVDDVMNAWKKISQSLMARKEVLGRLFLPETVSRIINNMIIMKPLGPSDYSRLIEMQVKAVELERLRTLDKEKKVYLDRTLISLEITNRYKQFLLGEEVVPSEGGRNTVMGAHKQISSDLQAALDHLPKAKPYGSSPLVITLDFLPGRSQVIAYAELRDSKEPQRIKILERAKVLKFPSMKMRGRVSEERLLTAAHEFGHAFVAVTVGQRIEHVVVVPPNASIGGYVKYARSNSDGHAPQLVMRLYSAVASRALERMFLHNDPRTANSSWSITAGPSGDIQSATSILYSVLYELGFDPNFGVMSRGAQLPFASIPHETVEKLAKILRSMEDFLIEDLLKQNTRDWYVEKIVRLAKEGVMNEAEFYDLLGFKNPGENRGSYGKISEIQNIFSKYVVKESAEIIAARNAKRGLTSRTSADALQLYMLSFTEAVQKHLYSASATKPLGSAMACGKLFN